MLQIHSDTSKVQIIIEKLVATIKENDGYLHPDMIICCRQGQLSIHASSREMQDNWLFKIPHRCLIPINKFTWGMHGDNIVIKSVSKDATPLQQEIAGLMVDLLNRTEKIKHFNNTCLLLRAKKHRALIEMLFMTRNFDAQGVEKILNYCDDLEFYLDTFLHTRTYGHSKSADSLMPLMDFMNHHCYGAVFLDSLLEDSLAGLNGADSEPFLGVMSRCQVQGSSECFANYGFYKDSYDIFLLYQYVDMHIPFQRSVPLGIDLGDTGYLKINASISIPGFKDTSQLPEHLQHLWFYLPTIHLDLEPRKTITLAYLYFPEEQKPFAMRDVLYLAIRELNRSLTQNQMQELILLCEQKIIDKNIEKCNSLSMYIHNITCSNKDKYFFSMIQNLVEKQMNKIFWYKSFHGYNKS